MSAFRGLGRKIAALAAVLTLFGSAVPVGAAPVGQLPLPSGTVIALTGTPHLWIADDQSTLHWGGDTRGLANRFANWNDRREVTLAQLRSFRIGDPWLSAGLIKIGDPIYLAKWETNQDRPTLLHIQSIGDVELFGINGNNYGGLVLNKQTWERRFSMTVASLPRGVLASAVPAAPAASAATATTATAATTGTTAVPAGTATPVSALTSKVSRTFTDLGGNPQTFSIRTTVELTGAPPSTMIRVAVHGSEYRCSPACESGYKFEISERDARQTDTMGVFTWYEDHSTRSEYTYSFRVPATGQTAVVKVDNDYTILP